MCGATSQARVHTHGCVEIRIGFTHDSRRRAARGQPRNIDAARIDVVILYDLSRDARDEGGLAVIAGLVARPEPVPTLRGIGGLRLLRIDDETPATFGCEVHSRPCREIISRLRAPVQHDDQRAWSVALAAWGCRVCRIGYRWHWKTSR